MTRPRLTFACGYYDRTDALRTGDVTLDGLDLDFVPVEAPRELFDRMGGKLEFDASEFSSSELISQHARGDSPFVAIPVFPSRIFRHSYIYVNRKSGIRSPKDIAGKRVGVPLYTMTAAVWIRGILTNEYGVDFSNVTWTEGAINHAGLHGDATPPPLLKPVAVAHDPAGRSLSQLLAAHEIDVIMGTQHPDPHPDIVPLFADARAVEREFAIKSRIFPIMHLVVIRRDVYDRDNSVAEKLFTGLVKAKALALARMRKGHPFMLPWVHDDIVEVDEVFGGDCYPYGLEANRPTLEALVTYMHEQHFIPRKIPLEELFVPVPKDLK